MKPRIVRKITHQVSDLQHFLDSFSIRYNKSCISISLIFLIVTFFAPSISVGAPLDNWTARTSDSTVLLDSIAYGNGKFVAVGYGGKIVTSTDGETWTSLTPGTEDYDLNGIAYGNSQFISVGSYDGSSGAILTSPDGNLPWTRRTSNTNKDLYSVAYGTNVHVAVGARSDGGAATVLTSPNGTDWTARTCGVPTTAGIVLKGIAYGGGKFVAVSTSGVFITATDSGAICSGSQWSQVTTNISGSFSAIAYGNGNFVAVGDTGKVVYSADGTNWSPLTISGSPTFYGIAYGNGKFVAIGGSGKIYSAADTDLTTWTLRASGTTVTLYGAAFGSPKFVAVGTVDAGSAKVLQSDDTRFYTVSTSAGANGDISPASRTVDHNYQTDFTLTPADHFHLASVSGCGSGAVSPSTNFNDCTNSTPCVYTTPAITGTCEVSATFTSDQYSVTAVPNNTPAGHGQLDNSYSSPVSVNWGGDTTFRFNAQANYHVATISGCGGTPYSNTSNSVTTRDYTTGAITGSCQVEATFAINTFTVTSTVSGANGTISPTPTVTPVNYNATLEFTLTPEANYHSSASGCSGTLVGNAYTTGAITGDCTVTASFPIDTHTVTTHVAVDGTGSIDPMNPNDIVYNTQKDFTIIAAANYHIDSVTGSGCTIYHQSGNIYRIDAVTVDCSITATFVIDTYEITPSMVGNPPNGTISPADTTPVNHGATQLFEFFPSSGYHVKAVLIDGGEGSGGTTLGANTNSYTFENITSAHTVSVEFEQNAAVQHTLLTSANTGGTVSCSPNPVTHGSNSVCTITPAAGYHLQTLLDNNLPKTCATTGCDYTALTVTTTDRLINATFELYITATATPSAGGVIDTAGIDGTGKVSIVSGGSAQYSITPNTGYHIESVTLDGVAVPLTTWNTYASNPYTVEVATANRAIAATFAKNTYTITPTVTPGGSISPSGVQTVEYGASKTFTFIAEDGNQVSEVRVNDQVVTTANSKAFDNVTSNQTLKVSFALYTYEITVNAGAGGKITASGSLTANWGESRTFTIVPDTGYHIVDVTLDGTSIKSELSSTNTYVLSNIKAIHTVAATFAIDTFTITASSDSNGSITPSGAATANYGNTKIYTITPKDGYHILDVLVDGVSVSVTDGTYTFADIDKDHTIAVTFSINTYAIIASAGPNGTITPSGTTTLESGTSKTYTITPGEIYHVADVKVDGTSVGAVTSYQFTGITANHTIEASFAINDGTYTITVITSQGKGSGVVTSLPSGINCGVTCSKTVNADTSVTLTAVSNTGSEFGGWTGGGCAGTDTSCTVNKNADATVNAVFNVPGQVSLTISKIGTGNGVVKLTSSAPGIGCGSDCYTYTVDEKKKPVTVKLTATVKPDSKFTGWSGDCAESKLKRICSVTMQSAKAAIANFDLKVPNIITPASLSFGTAKVVKKKVKKVVKKKVKAVTKVAKITNKGDGILKISKLEITGDSDFTLILSSSTATVKPKASISVRIKFNPTSAGAKSAELQISSNDPVKPLVTVALSGTSAAVSAKSSSAGSDSRFYPGDPVTREEAVAFVIRAVESEPADNYCEDGSPFADVSPDAWSCKYVKRADERSLITGCLDGNAGFCPVSFMSREEMAALIVRTIDGEPEESLCESGSPFSDIIPDRWSCRYIKRFNELGIDTGYDAHNLKTFTEEFNFYPEVLSTREETAVYLIRAIEGEPPADYCKSGSPFDDVTNSNPSCRYIKRLYEIWTSPKDR